MKVSFMTKLVKSALVGCIMMTMNNMMFS